MSKVHDMGGREEKRPIPFLSCVDKSEELSLTGEAPEYLYTVEFASQELWGKSYPNRKDAVTLDLWEPYLKKANEAK